MPSPKKKGTKKLVKKFASPLEVSSASQESQEPNQVWPPKTPSYLGPPTPLPSSSAAYQDSPDLFAEDVEIDPVGSPYSEQIATLGCSVEHGPSAVVTVDKPRIQVVAAAEDDGNSDDPAMQQSGQDLSILERDWSEHSEEQAQLERDDDDASTDKGEVVGTRVKNISLTRKKRGVNRGMAAGQPVFVRQGASPVQKQSQEVQDHGGAGQETGAENGGTGKMDPHKKDTLRESDQNGQKWYWRHFTHAVGQMDPEAVQVPGPSYRQTTGHQNARNWQGKNKQNFIYIFFFLCFFFGAAKCVGGIVFFFI